MDARTFSDGAIRRISMVGPSHGAIRWPAYLGHNPMDNKNVYIITGDSGNGMTHCTVRRIAGDRLDRGRSNPWQPSMTLRASGARQFQIRIEQANTLSQYGDWVTGGEVDSVQEIRLAMERSFGMARANWRCTEMTGGLHALSAAVYPFRLCRTLEFRRKVLGLSLPWLALWYQRYSASWSGHYITGSSNAGSARHYPG